MKKNNSSKFYSIKHMYLFVILKTIFVIKTIKEINVNVYSLSYHNSLFGEIELLIFRVARNFQRNPRRRNARFLDLRHAIWSGGPDRKILPSSREDEREGKKQEQPAPAARAMIAP